MLNLALVSFQQIKINSKFFTFSILSKFLYIENFILLNFF